MLSSYCAKNADVREQCTSSAVLKKLSGGQAFEFWFCSLINHQLHLIPSFLCLSAALFSLLSNLCSSSLCLLTFSVPLLLFHLISSSFNPMQTVDIEHKRLCSLFSSTLSFFPLQQDLQVSKTDLGRDANISLSGLFLFLNSVNVHIFLSPFSFCGAARLHCCFCLTPRFSLVPNFVSKSSSYFFLFVAKTSLTF